MFWKIARYSVILFFGLVVFSCSEYQKALKDTDVSRRYEYAQKMYDEGDYKKANRLFEAIAPQFVGKPQGERVMFFLADSYYQIGDYNFAGYQFERFLKSYPRSDKAPEAAFLGAKSYYMLSPRYSLDQTDTDKALTKLQLFINAYPESENLPEANAMAQELTTKKEKKAFEIAKQFVKLGEYYVLDYNLSAISSLDNFVNDHPGSIYREEALFQKFRATVNLAVNSTFRKRKERLDEALVAYENLMRSYPETEFSDDAEKLYEVLQEELSKYTELEKLAK
ncbi:outer membrane protein assembly factor BamD [Robiginitalea aurantiaca]|uniref:Outer membrane protein assembly factor BamD n=1 Tax=Robiginitalea aurantiaca TaxID=3056915 RepID=A0ABT7WGA2_9FLAO|nr:outer membrane protein assembly factor BamD [Robiginitalea aurantiaca]MDM9631950.1 outer membrane protein assembly factor BamD [Robiginitalea aurantiaca]